MTMIELNNTVNDGERARRFPDMRSAGRDLAPQLDAHRGSETVILAIALGGVLVALEVAKHLGMPFDIVLLRRLLVPQGRDAPVCAFNVAGTLVLDEALPPLPAVPGSPLDYFLADALQVFASREQMCRGGRPQLDLAGKTVLLIDNGIRTGVTMRVVIRALRTRQPARIVAAVPVAAPESRACIEEAADEFLCLAWRQPFGHVGLWYADFTRPGDDKVHELLEEAERRAFA